MATKWKGWTARRAVKIVSFTLILVLCFAILNRINTIIMRADDTEISPEIIFSNLDGNRYFFDRHMHNAYYYASQLLYFKSEASILAGEHIKWFETGEENEFYLATPEGNNHYAWIHESYSDSEELRAARRIENEQYAIQNQLSEFRSAISELDNAYGLMYCIKSGGTTLFTNLSNSDTFTANDFWSQYVYFTYENSHEVSSRTSGFSSMPYNWYSNNLENAAIYLAFTADAVDAKNGEYTAAKDAYVLDITLIAIAGVLILALLAVLLAGAGRRYADDMHTVRFAVADRPFLDLSLAAVICWMAFLYFVIEDAGYVVWYYKNLTAINLLFAAMSAAFLAPALLWILSLAKRMKAGKFWRHTLIWFVPSRCARFIKSLWCGFPLTAKALLVCAATFCFLSLAGVLGNTWSYAPGLIFFTALIFTAVIDVFLLRYARRIYVLEQGAAAINAGRYDTIINVGGGELGGIASSIMSISEGINRAVEQRMKSERLKAELITNVSHDIRTPLTSIITYTDLLKHEGLDCEKAPEYLDILIQKSARLKTLTDELFEAAKAASGNIEVSITELDLVSLIGQVLGELDSAVGASTLDLRVKLPEKAPVRADGKLLWRVMENLMSNVFKYALPCSRVYLSVEPDGAFMRLELKNISSTELSVDPSELTERFKRGDEARADGGNGLGLSIVQSFVDAQNGRFTVSIDGDLFKATVLLPAAGDRVFGSGGHSGSGNTP